MAPREQASSAAKYISGHLHEKQIAACGRTSSPGAPPPTPENGDCPVPETVLREHRINLHRLHSAGPRPAAAGLTPPSQMNAVTAHLPPEMRSSPGSNVRPAAFHSRICVIRQKISPARSPGRGATGRCHAGSHCGTTPTVTMVGFRSRTKKPARPSSSDGRKRLQKRQKTRSNIHRGHPLPCRL